MGVVIRLVWLECIGLISRCCKEVYRFSRNYFTYSYIHHLY